MRYWDPIAGEYRIKRRYVWGAWGFATGGIAVLILVSLL